jgi:hypothetical protein
MIHYSTRKEALSREGKDFEAYPQITGACFVQDIGKQKGVSVKETPICLWREQWAKLHPTAAA